MVINISTILLNASRQKVWDALTRPELVQQWQYGSRLLTGWTVGGSITFTAEWEGKEFRQWGRVLSFRPSDSLSYSLFAPVRGLEDRPENYFVMRYMLTDDAGKTRLEIIQEDHRPGAVQEQEAPGGDENPVLQALRQVVEA